MNILEMLIKIEDHEEESVKNFVAFVEQMIKEFGRPREEVAG